MLSFLSRFGHIHRPGQEQLLLFFSSDYVTESFTQLNGSKHSFIQESNSYGLRNRLATVSSAVTLFGTTFLVVDKTTGNI